MTVGKIKPNFSNIAYSLDEQCYWIEDQTELRGTCCIEFYTRRYRICLCFFGPRIRIHGPDFPGGLRKCCKEIKHYL
jgi:hypothetical protein